MKGHGEARLSLFNRLSSYVYCGSERRFRREALLSDTISTAGYESTR